MDTRERDKYEYNVVFGAHDHRERGREITEGCMSEGDELPTEQELVKRFAGIILNDMTDSSSLVQIHRNVCDQLGAFAQELKLTLECYPDEAAPVTTPGRDEVLAKEARDARVRDGLKCAECGQVREHQNHWAPFGWHNFEEPEPEATAKEPRG